MLAGGAGFSYHKGGWSGLAYFGGGVLGGYIGYSAAMASISRPVVGGQGNCSRCMPQNAEPSGNFPELDYGDLFEGNEMITSEYGWRINPRTGEMQIHGGMDVMPVPRPDQFGTPLLAPSGGEITAISSGGIYFRPLAFPNFSSLFSSSLFFYHVSLSPSLAGLALPIQVQAGTVIGNLANIGSLTGPHVHIQFESSGSLYNPRFVFP